MGYLFKGNDDSSWWICKIFGGKKSEACKNSQGHMEISILICNVILKSRRCEGIGCMANNYWLVFSLPEEQGHKMIEVWIVMYTCAN